MQNTRVYIIENNWYSWVPTNLGQLNFSYIGDSSSLGKVFGPNHFKVQSTSPSNKIIHLKNTNLSDLNSINNFINNIAEAKDSAVIDITDRSSHFQGTVTIEYNKKVEIKGDFVVEINGEVKISNVTVTYDTDKVNTVTSTAILDNTIVTAIYTVLKKVIHGDNHHEQKIDTFIGVYVESFDPLKILDSFAANIKSRERVVKDSTRNNCYYKQQKMLSAIEVDGYISYIETFNTLFKTTENEDLLKEKIQYIKNVTQSLKASVEKIKFDLDSAQKHITLFMTFVAFIVSINIIHSGLYGEISDTMTAHGKIDYIMWSIFIVMTMYMASLKAVCYSRYLSKTEAFWEYMRYQALKEKNILVKLYTFAGTVALAFASLMIIKNILLCLLKSILV